jgi:hypothetical protein
VVVDVDLGSGQDVTVPAHAGDQIVLRVRTFGSTGRLWRLQLDSGSCEISGHAIEPGDFTRPGIERFTLGVRGTPCSFRLILQAPWLTQAEREFRIDVIEEAVREGS